MGKQDIKYPLQEPGSTSSVRLQNHPKTESGELPRAEIVGPHVTLQAVLRLSGLSYLTGVTLSPRQ